MYLLSDYNSIGNLVNRIKVDKVYPLSIIEGKQQGEIFSDSITEPKKVLFWHYCGFAYIVGEIDEEFLSDIIAMMKQSKEKHSGRLALQVGKEDLISDNLLAYRGIKKEEQYLFEFIGMEEQLSSLDNSYKIEKIDELNYEMISGRIIPKFSWQSKTVFLENGFGYCLFVNGRFAACAFSAGISEKYVDIGVETVKEYQGKGYGKIISQIMVKEICQRGMIPIWECNTSNIASMKLACSIGFRIKDTHPLYLL